MRGKTVLITGANSGIGFVTARELARIRARVLMICRDTERGANARAAVAQAATGAAPLLINNAAGIFAERELTADGIERTFATNHLGPFLLTNLVLDLVKAATGGRIVNVAAEGYPSKLDFGNLEGGKRYGFLSAYFRSKLAITIFSNDLAHRLKDSGVSVNCMSPGPTRTRFGDNMRGFAGLFPRLLKMLFPSAATGARTLIYLASSPEVDGISGRFFLRQRARPTKPVTSDPEVAARLWRVSAELVGLSVDTQLAGQPRTEAETSSRSAA